MKYLWALSEKDAGKIESCHIKSIGAKVVNAEVSTLSFFGEN